MKYLHIKNGFKYCVVMPSMNRNLKPEQQHRHSKSDGHACLFVLMALSQDIVRAKQKLSVCGLGASHDMTEIFDYQGQRHHLFTDL